MSCLHDPCSQNFLECLLEVSVMLQGSAGAGVESWLGRRSGLYRVCVCGSESRPFHMLPRNHQSSSRYWNQIFLWVGNGTVPRMDGPGEELEYWMLCI